MFQEYHLDPESTYKAYIHVIDDTDAGSDEDVELNMAIAARLAMPAIKFVDTFLI